MGSKVMRAGESNCVKDYKRLEEIAKLAISYVLPRRVVDQYLYKFLQRRQESYRHVHNQIAYALSTPAPDG